MYGGIENGSVKGLNNTFPKNGSIGPIGGVELLAQKARNSLNSVRRFSISSTASSSPRSTYSHSIDDRHWSWKYLRDQFTVRNLEDLYSRYLHRLRRAYYSIFVLLSFILGLIHIIMLMLSMDKIEEIVADIIAYSSIGILPLIALAFSSRMTRRRPWLPLVLSWSIVLALIASDLIVPLVHAHSNPRLRPAYATHTLLACYVFLPLVENIHAFLVGVVVTVCHLLALWMIVYANSSDTVKLAADAVYLMAINGLGLYFRYMNEIVIRRTFLDSRACVESTMKLHYEKDQEETLMLSILPEHIAIRVKDDIKKTYQALQDKGHKKERPFSDLYIERHYNVTILYADIVNYTKMTASLPVRKLVEILNELFGRFDDASFEHDVLRIKFLGDCYYCISGIPDANKNHAKNCVDLALDMISIIREVRDHHNLDIDMRIGVHSGRTFSGLVGWCKWQYDIWSKDVDIANRMEQTGTAGKVHLTKQTLDQLKNCDYKIERAYGELKDEFLKKNKIETYLISPGRERLERDESYGDLKSIYSRRNSNAPNKFAQRPKNSVRTQRISELEIVPVSGRRGNIFMDSNIQQYQRMLAQADANMAKAIEDMPLKKFEQWFNNSDWINPILLTFNRKLKWELPFLAQPDPLFKFYVTCALAVLICMCAVEFVTLPPEHRVVWTTFIAAICILLCLVPLTWTHYIWKFWTDEPSDGNTQPKNCFVRTLFRVSKFIMMNTLIRTALYIFICALLAACAMIDLVKCNKNNNTNISNNATTFETQYDFYCVNPWHATESCSLAILMCFLFLRIHFLLKLVFGSLIVFAYSFVIINYNDSFTGIEKWNMVLDSKASHIMHIAFLTLTLHFIDRQSEYMSRLDFRWKRQLVKEQEEASTTHVINTMLLRNILPVHVADIFLNTKRPRNDLYYEEYETVAVMFATITGYTTEIDADSENAELALLGVLNEVICNFDKLLLEPTGHRIEKIKMARWTYMAACGLDPGRKDSVQGTMCRRRYKDHVATALTRFATQMMSSLNDINQQKNTNFKLRVGISHGKIFAGVVGAKKPLYDIWGDSVNMASRMDSTGVPDKIQITENTAMTLFTQGIQCKRRGKIAVKGRDELVTTYFVSLDENMQLVNRSADSYEDTRL